MVSAASHSGQRRTPHARPPQPSPSYTFRSAVLRHRAPFALMTVTTVTYYDVLKLNRRARPDAVRLAYRRLAQKYHPDKLPGNSDAQRVMAALNEAYAVLSDAQRRASYDRSLGQEREQSRQAFLRRLAEVRAQDRVWPWWVLFGTLAFCTAAVGVSVYKGYVPGARPVAATHASANATSLR